MPHSGQRSDAWRRSYPHRAHRPSMRRRRMRSRTYATRAGRTTVTRQRNQYGTITTNSPLDLSPRIQLYASNPSQPQPRDLSTTPTSDPDNSQTQKPSEYGRPARGMISNVVQPN